MISVVFTANLRRHFSTEPRRVEAATVRQALDAVFVDEPAVRSFILDDQGALRKHVTIFIDGEPIADRIQLSDPVAPDAELYVAQALSGG